MFILHAHAPSAVPFTFFSLFRLARSSILASVIHIMPGGPLRVGAFFVSGLFVVLYIVIIAHFIWVCEINDEEPDGAGYVPFLDPASESY